MLLVLPRTQTSLPHWKFAHKGRRHGENGWDVFISHFSHSHDPLRFITSHSRVSRVSRSSLCRKRLKRLRKGSLLFVTNGRLLLKAFISTFMTCRAVSWRHIGHSLNTQITQRRKLTRRFDIPQKQPTVYNKDLPLVRLSFGSFIDTRKKLRDSGIHL